jgi:hypothetical protein
LLQIFDGGIPQPDYDGVFSNPKELYPGCKRKAKLTEKSTMKTTEAQ